MSTTTEKLAIFQRLVECSQPIMFSEFDARTFEVLSCSTASDSALFFLLSMDSCTDMASIGWPDFDGLRVNGAYRPIICTNSLGMAWLTEIEELAGKPYRIHAVGPVFFSDYSLQSIQEHLLKYNLSAEICSEVLNFIHDIPVVSTIRFYEYGLMLHWCLYEELITISDLMYRNAPDNRHTDYAAPPANYHGTYLAEQRMLRSVREGNLQYRKEMDQLSLSGGVGEITTNENRDHLRELKNYVIIYTALCCRTAVQGGLDVETAYTLSDRYLQSVEEAGNISSLHEISNAMVKDYIERVHRAKNADCLSPKIRAACEWIALAPQEQSIHSLAERLGYTDYYFSKRFKKETGVSVKSYILQQKMEAAKQLLAISNLSVAEITDRLGIESSSYFAASFHKTTGMTPLDYRAMHKK